MAHTTKVFRSGNSQAVRIPREFRIEDDEIFIQRIGSAIILVPKSDPWAAFRESLDQFSDDFMADGRDMSDVFD